MNAIEALNNGARIKIYTTIDNNKPSSISIYFTGKGLTVTVTLPLEEDN